MVLAGRVRPTTHRAFDGAALTELRRVVPAELGEQLEIGNKQAGEVSVNMDDVSRRSVLAGLAAAAIGTPAHSANWPVRPVTWLVPFPSGGEIDLFVRPLAAKVAASLGRAVEIDHRGGFGGALGASVVAIAPPDGYMMLVGYTGLCYASLVYPQATVDLGKSFIPVSAFARVPYALVVNPARLGVGTFAQFLAAAEQKPGTIEIASSGVGTVSHLAVGLLEARAAIKLRHAAYRGFGAALQALASGEVAATLAPVSSILDDVKSAKLRVLAVANQRREPLLPDVPTFAEAGLSDFRVGTWYGLFAPNGTPAAILDRVHGAVQAALDSTEVKSVWQQAGAKVEAESRADFAQFVDREIVAWRRIAQAANVRLE
jgi:tripartite-type tricarboxylate transporter receptor subunit TctC